MKNIGKTALYLSVSCLFSLVFSYPAWCLEKKLTTSSGMTFILVQPGSFDMGSPETEENRDKDEVRHRVILNTAFYLQETEVTLKQWQAVMGRSMFLKRRGKPDMPVTRVSFYDTQKFIEKLNNKGHSPGIFRLPTEQEWEYACRAGTQTAYSWGDAIDCSKAVYGNNTKKHDQCTLFFASVNIRPNGPAPVKRFLPNPWGFYDMHGNVWEWCDTEYGDYSDPAEKTQFAFSKSPGRIRRGGSWFKYGHYLRSANRTYAHPGSKFKTTGFRLVLDPH